MHRFKLDTIQSLFSRCCLLGCLLWGLWGCGTVPKSAAVLQPNPDWQTLQSAAVQLAVPPGYVGGEPGRQLAELQATLERWGFGDRAEWLAQNAENIELLAFRQGTDPLEHLDNINIVQADRPDQLSVLDYLKTQAAQLQAAGITIDRLDQSGEMGQLQSHRDGLWQTSYVYPTETEFWVITYSNHDQSEAVLRQVERSRQSFQLLPAIP